jgi:hypothetical protein
MVTYKNWDFTGVAVLSPAWQVRLIDALAFLSTLLEEKIAGQGL